MRLFAFALVISLSGSLGAQDDGGYRRQLDDARKRLNPELCTGGQLIAHLKNDDFYLREAAKYELIKRRSAEFEKVLDAQSSNCAETRQRAGEIVRSIAWQTEKSIRAPFEPEIKLVVTHPRFWSGTNAWRGGIQDESLDATVNIESSRPLERVRTPLPVKYGRTDNGEEIFTLPWSWSDSSTTSGVVYMTKPQMQFQTVELTLLVCAVTRGPPDNVQRKFRTGRFEINKEIVWGEITEPKGDGVFLLTVVDLLGRLETATVEFENDGARALSKVVPGDGAQRRVWTIDTNGRTTTPHTLRLIVPGPLFCVERGVKVTVAHPK